MAVDRSRLPEVGVNPPFRPPGFSRSSLSNGIQIWTATHRRAPVLTLKLLIPVGSADDPTSQPGLAALTADILDEGTLSLTDVELHESLTRIGAHLGIEVSTDATILTVTTLPKHAAAGMALLVDVATHPRFAPEDCERVRDLRLSRVLQMRQVPSAVADRVFVESLYGQHPYGHLAIGTDASLRQLQSTDVAAFHRQWYCPSSCTLIAVGDLAEGELRETARDALGPIVGETSHADSQTRSRSLDPPPARERLVLVPRPDAVQSEIRLGHVGAPRSSQDYHALLVLNMVLGGQFISRINLNLREDKGYTYGARSSFEWRVGPGPFVFRSSVQTNATADALREAIKEIDEIRGARPVTEAELAVARAALTRGFPRSFETASQVARGGAGLALHGLPVDEMTRFVDRVSAIDVDATQRVARDHLHPDRLVAVVVGASDEVQSSLGDLGLGDATLLD